MTEKTEQLEFDFDSYINSLMEVMEMREADQTTQEIALEGVLQQVNFRIFEALTLNFKNDDWSFLINATNIENLKDLVQQAIERSPTVKQAVVEALDEFYNEILDAFNEFKTS